MTNAFELNAMHDRLAAAIQASGRSERDISIAAGLSHGSLNSLTKNKRDPGVETLAQICNELGVSLSYILYGVDVSPEAERLLSLIDQNPDRRDAILALLKSEM